ncbi:hypothetical protein [Burkholderia pseudomultivorans]|uniref:hypothetical protein n=1 Tax=Burkholderia pseudomultivorans TaxID=1207504 RepID=UPI000756E357|nr:hypothetical protein [Burkholderia pseudomultivorans]AOI88964.1 hypothetical protein WS57_09200 [Burkholderia pseudomultivorans]KVC29290.1 hypothetical protein WS56_19635 [Burkholderia pseudomultivorans]KVC34614.1 hypothetical protein WS55_33610 [Burkholderia pseudomultivorans]
MGAGFQAFTDSGVYQIDGSTPNYQMVQAMAGQSVTTGLPFVVNDAGISFGANLPNVSFTFTSTAGPMYGVFASDGVGITIWSTEVSGSAYTLRFVTERECTVYFFLFDRVPVASGRFGLQVFNERGDLIADSSKPFLRVLDVIFDEYFPPGTGWVSADAPNPKWNSRTYGVPVIVSAIYPVHVGWSYSPAGVELTSIRVSGKTISWGTTMYGGGRKPGFSGFREQWRQRFMVLDGTGIV